MAKKISEDYIKFTLSLNSTQAQQEIHKLSKESEELKKENKSLQNEMNRLTAAGKRNSTEFKNLRGQLRLNNQTIDENNAKIRQLNSTLKLGERTMADLRKETGQLKRALDHTSKALEPEAYEKYAKRLKEVREEMSKLSGKGEDTAGIFKKIGWLKLGAIGSISQFGYNFTNFLTDSIGKMKDWVTESTEMAESADGVLRAFKQLDNPGLLRNLRTATKGTVTDLDLMKAAVKARDFRIPLEDLGKYLAFAQMKAQQTGQSVDYMVDSIVTGLGRQSVMILDNLGLSSAEINDEIAKTGDFMKGVATIVEKNLASAGETYISAADRAAQATTELANRQLEMGRKLLPIKETVASVYEQVQIWLVNAATWMMDHAKAVMTVIALLGSYLAVSKAIAAAEAIRLSVMTNIRGMTLLFAAAQAKLTGHTARAAAMRLFNTTCKANVIGAIVAVVTAATVAFIAFRKETDKVAEINNRAEKSVAGERAELEALKRIIHDSSQSYESRKTAIEQMQKLVPNYHASLTTEGKLIEKNAAAIDLYVQKQLLAAKQQEAKAKYQEAIGARADWVSGQDKKTAMQMKEVEWSLKDFQNQGKSEEEVIAGAGVSVTAFRAWREQKQQLDNEVKQYGKMLADYARQMAELESKFVNKRESINPIIDVLSSVVTPSDLANYIKSKREEQANKAVAADQEFYERLMADDFHMSLDEYNLYMERLETENPFAGVNVGEIDAIFAEAEEQYQEYLLKQQENEQGTTNRTAEESNNILSPEQSGNASTTAGSQENGSTERNGSEATEADAAASKQEVGTSVVNKAKIPSEPIVKDGTIFKNNEAGGDAVAVVIGSEVNDGERRYMVSFAPDKESADAKLFFGDKWLSESELQQWLNDGRFTSLETEAKPKSVQTKIEAAEAETNTDPTEAQKKAGNYKMGHVQIGNFDISIENPAGSERKGIDATGRPWSTKMQNTYGYMRGTEGVDGDHIDVFLANDMDAWNGQQVFVVDQYNEDGTFDEHKVMLGFNSQEEAKAAYFANYDKDWGKKHKTVVTPVNLEDFEKWVDSSHRKTKAFAEYKSVKNVRTDHQGNPMNADGTLLVEKIERIGDITDEDFLNSFRNVQLPTIPQKVADAIGTNGKPVVIKKNIFEKNRKGHKDVTPEQGREILLNALYNPTMYGKNQKTKRPYNWILIHNATKHSSVVLEVNHNKDNVEIVNWHFLDDESLEQKERQAINEGGLILTLESAAGNTINGLSSDNKDTKSVSEKQVTEVKSVAAAPTKKVKVYSFDGAKSGIDLYKAVSGALSKLSEKLGNGNRLEGRKILRAHPRYPAINTFLFDDFVPGGVAAYYDELKDLVKGTPYEELLNHIKVEEVEVEDKRWSVRDEEGNQDQVTTPENMRKLVDTICKKLGLKVAWHKTLPENGRFEPDTRTIHIAMDAENPLAQVFGHETTHAIKAISPEAYDDLKSAVKSFLGDKWEGLVSGKKDLYGRAGYKNLPMEYYEEEVVCDTVGRMIEDKAVAGRIISGLNQTVLGKIKDVLRKILDALSGVFSKDRRAFNNLASAIDKAMKESALHAGEQILTDSGETAGYIDNRGNYRASERTYHNFKDRHGIEHEGTRERTKRFLEDRGLPKKQVNSFLKTMDYWYDLNKKISELTDENGNFRFNAFHEWSQTVPVYKEWEGKIVRAVSTMVANGEYPVNLELSTDCIKREAFTQIMDEMIKLDNKFWSKLNPANIVNIQTLEKAYGIQVACPLCFVEGKRLGLLNWANSIIKKWNEALVIATGTKKHPEFGFGKGTFVPPTDKLEYNALPADKKKELEKQINEVCEIINSKEGLKPEDLDAIRQADTRIAKKLDSYEEKWVKEHGSLDGFVPTEVQMNELKTIAVEGGKTAVDRMVRIIEEYPELRRRLTIEDLVGSKGLMAMRTMDGAAYEALFSLIRSANGSGTPKLVQTAQPYDGEIVDLTQATIDKASSVGGVRIFSFSDFDLTKVFDIMQILFDCAAREAKIQSYSKEVPYILMFGTSGVKINMSMLPEARPEPGLAKVAIKGNGKSKESVEAMHTIRENVGLEMGEDGKILGLQLSGSHSIPEEFAKSIFHDNKYNSNCGAIMVGIGVNHAIYSMCQPHIRMVIPFHLSGMPIAARKKTDCAYYVDFTKDQNTGIIKDGKRVKLITPKGSNHPTVKEDFDFYADENNPGWNMRDKCREYIEWCEQNGLVPKFDWAINADHYRSWCEQNGYEPNAEIVSMMEADTTDGIFNQYYKVITDFTAYQPIFDKEGNMIGERTAPHKPVTANFTTDDKTLSAVLGVDSKGNYVDDNSMLANRERSIDNVNKFYQEIAAKGIQILGGRKLNDVIKEAQEEIGNKEFDNKSDSDKYFEAIDSGKRFSLREGTNTDAAHLRDAADTKALNEENEKARTSKMFDNLTKAAKTIHNWIARKARGKVFTIELPEATRRMIRNVMGRDFDSHNITINGIRHGLKNHGVDGKKLNENSIPIREEDAELIPYIMTAPDYVRKGSEDVTGRESIRFYKTLSNGYVVVVEKEYENSPNDMETINIWAEMSSEAINAQHKTVPDTNVQNAILSTDAAKIRKDAEEAIRKEEKLREQQENSTSVDSKDKTTRYSLRTKPAPKKTKKCYKLMRLGTDGNLYPLFIDGKVPVELGNWYDADSPALDALKELPSGVHLLDNETNESIPYDQFFEEYQELFKGGKQTKFPSKEALDWANKNNKRFMFIEDTEKGQKRFDGENRKYWNLGINGSGSVSTFSMRPGWHAGTLPTMRQIGKGKDKDLRDDSFVWVEGRLSADIDYNKEAQQNPDKDIPDRIPEDGYYLKATNADKKKSQADKVGWYVAGSFLPKRIISDAEAREVIDEWNEKHPGDNVEYDYPRESGKVFNADTMQLEESRFSLREHDERMTIIEEAEENGTYMLAPNGEQSNLDEEQWVNVRTQAFKDWFGDWENDPENASKILDENGEPRVVYHQTNSTQYVNVETGENWDDLDWRARDEWENRDDWDEYWEEQDFYTFDNKNHGRSSVEMPAFFFSPRYDEYHEYGDRTIAAFLNLRNPIKNPTIPDRGVTNDAGKKAMEHYIEQGYDGFIREYDGEIDEINAFFPNQIKSAEENDGSYSKYDDDIRYSMREKEKPSRRQSELDRKQMTERVDDLSAKMHLDNLEIVTDTSELEGRKARAKGWFNPKTGKIVVVVPNHKSVADVEQTVLHEAVAHYGLRKLFGDHFDDFLMDVYRNAERGVRDRIVKLAQKRGWKIDEAIEEYLAGLAERQNYEEAVKYGWFAKIKAFFNDLLRKTGLGLQCKLSDNDLRYMLWKSYSKLTGTDGDGSLMDMAEDIAKQHELKVGNYVSSSPAARYSLREDENTDAIMDATALYEAGVVNTFWNRFKEGWHDYLRSVRIFQESLEKEIGRKLHDFENVYLHAMHKSSIDNRQWDKMMKQYVKPFNDLLHESPAIIR